jgi:hypothetical protein
MPRTPRKSSRHASRQRSRQEPRQAPPPPAHVQERVEAKLRELYAQVPGVECKGRCWDSCGRIFMTGHEERTLLQLGYRVPNDMDGSPAVCPALTMLHRCGVYEHRPMICRLWGVAQGMVCGYGCRPERVLSYAELYELLAQAYEAAGEFEHAAACRAPFASPELAARSVALWEAEQREQGVQRDAAQAHAMRAGQAVWVAGRGQLQRAKPQGMV